MPIFSGAACAAGAAIRARPNARLANVFNDACLMMDCVTRVCVMVVSVFEVSTSVTLSADSAIRVETRVKQSALLKSAAGKYAEATSVDKLRRQDAASLARARWRARRRRPFRARPLLPKHRGSR